MSVVWIEAESHAHILEDAWTTTHTRMLMCPYMCSMEVLNFLWNSKVLNNWDIITKFISNLICVITLSCSSASQQVTNALRHRLAWQLFKLIKLESSFFVDWVPINRAFLVSDSWMLSYLNLWRLECGVPLRDGRSQLCLFGFFSPDPKDRV